MMGLALSAQDIQNAPPEVRRWLERQFLRAANEEPTPEVAMRSPKPSPIEYEVAKAKSSTVTSVIDGEGSAPKEGAVKMNQEDEAVNNAAIQRLIAERAYELWENHGRPEGFDLIHWREAEQEIMDCLKHGPVPLADGSPPSTGNV